MLKDKRNISKVLWEWWRCVCPGMSFREEFRSSLDPKATEDRRPCLLRLVGSVSASMRRCTGLCRHVPRTEEGFAEVEAGGGEGSYRRQGSSRKPQNKSETTVCKHECGAVFGVVDWPQWKGRMQGDPRPMPSELYVSRYASLCSGRFTVFGFPIS